MGTEISSRPLSGSAGTLILPLYTRQVFSLVWLHSCCLFAFCRLCMIAAVESRAIPVPHTLWWWPNKCWLPENMTSKASNVFCFTLLASTQNEEQVATAIQQHGIAREDVFITSKVCSHPSIVWLLSNNCFNHCFQLRNVYLHVLYAHDQYSFKSIRYWKEGFTTLLCATACAPRRYPWLASVLKCLQIFFSACVLL